MSTPELLRKRDRWPEAAKIPVSAVANARLPNMLISH
jgi:hypothetical protein